jgi:hypothetical protein
MTAFDLIDSIFARPASRGMDANIRRLTPEQLGYLRGLIERDAESAAVRPGAPGSLVWMPKGRHKYVITEDARGGKHTLARLSSIEAGRSGRLF